MTLLQVQGTQVWFKHDHEGPQVSCDNGETWRFTFRGEAEFRDMYRDYTIVDRSPNPSKSKTDEDFILEVFGDTLDEPLPDDFANFLLDN